MAEPGQVERLILSDDQGEYYLITRDMLEQARVTGQQKEEVAALVNQGREVQGYYFQQTQPINLFGQQFQYHGACACSYAACSSYSKVLR